MEKSENQTLKISPKKKWAEFCAECGKPIRRELHINNEEYFYKNEEICEECFDKFNSEGSPFISINI